MHKKDSFILKYNLTLIAGFFSILLEYYLINNSRDQYISMVLTVFIIPVLFHIFIFKRFHLIENQKYFSILLLPIKYLALLMYIFVIISIYDLTLIHKHHSASHIALKTPGIYLLVATLIYAFYLSLLFERHTLIRKSVNFILVFIGTLFCCFLAYHLLINELHRYNESSLNFGITINPIIQVFFGSTLMVDAKSQYGLYPHFFEPILHLTGISITSISAIMMILFLLTIGSWFIFLLKTTKNSLLSLIGLITATFVSLSLTTTWPGELYYQYFPIRTIFPALVLLIFNFYYIHRNWYSRIIITAILSLGIIWNIESGLGGFMSFIALDMYLEFDTSKKFKSNIYAIIKNTVASILTLIVVFLVFFYYLEIRSGTMPTLRDFFLFQIGYSKGAMLGQAPVLHPHKLTMILIYFIGASYGIGSMLSGYKDKLNSGIFLISIFGLCSSLYYMFKHYHHSHEGTALYPLIILITLFISRLLINLKPTNLLISLTQRYNRKWLINNHLSLFYLLFSLSFLSFVSSLFLASYQEDVNFTTTARYHEIIYPNKANNKSLGIVKLDDFESNQYKFDYIKIGDLADGNPKGLFPKWINTYKALEKYKNKNGSIREDMLILSMFDHFLYLKLNARMPIKLANTAHLWFDDYDRLDNIKNYENIQYVAIDNDELIIQLIEERFNSFFNIFKENFYLIENIETGNYIWYNNINPTRVNKESWDKHIIKIYKRKNSNNY